MSICEEYLREDLVNGTELSPNIVEFRPVLEVLFSGIETGRLWKMLDELKNRVVSFSTWELEDEREEKYSLTHSVASKIFGQKNKANVSLSMLARVGYVSVENCKNEIVELTAVEYLVFKSIEQEISDKEMKKCGLSNSELEKTLVQLVEKEIIM